MGLEIDFLAVGQGSRSGDAITLRYGNLHGPRSEQVVVVVDGGNQESGVKLVEFIQNHYHTDEVDYAISTHPDNDHICGLKVVLDRMYVGALLMHQPWVYAEEIRSFFKQHFAADSLEARLQRALNTAVEVEDVAKTKNIPIYEPFAGTRTHDGMIRILGPSEAYYKQLICHFRDTPVAKQPGLLGRFAASAREAVEWVRESLQFETLDDSGVSSAENNSSVITFINYSEGGILLTGDAGIPALMMAADYAAFEGINLQTLRFMQVPHHGSRRNVGPTILNRLSAQSAFVSCAPEGAPKHPAKKVINAFTRRGFKVYSTAGKQLRHQHDAPGRQGWSAVEPLPFYEVVEV